MQDEVNEKTVSLCIRCGKVTASLLKAAMKKALAKMEQEKQKLQGQKQPKQDKEDKTYRGKQSMDKLMKQNVQLSNIEITDGNIKSFERVAKKYSIDFSLKKDVNADPPRYYVFFKARDADVMTAAFKEYTGQSLNKDKKPSVRKKLQQAISKSLKKHRENKRKGERAVIMSRLQKLLGVGKGYLERLPPVDVHKLLRLILLNLPYIMIFYVGNKLAWLYQYCAGNSMIERLIVLVLNFQLAFSRILPSMHKNELLVGLTGAVGVKLMVYLKGKNAKKFRQGVEYGSARWSA